MGIKSTNRGGAGAGRGDNPHPEGPLNPHGVPMTQAKRYAESMGVHPNHVKGWNKAEFSGSVVGHTGADNMSFTAESTGGGVTDSINIRHPKPISDNEGSTYQYDRHFGVNRQNPEKGKKWTAKGTWDMDSGMSWKLEPTDGTFN